MNPRTNSNSASPIAEIKIEARAVSRGIATGNVICLYGRSRQFHRRTIATADTAAEIIRFRSALSYAREQLERLSIKDAASVAESAPEIFGAHLLILSEKTFAEKIEKEIEEKLVNAEWATKTIVDAYVLEYKAIPNENLRDTYIDVEDVGERIQNAFDGNGEVSELLPENSVIVAVELRPSTLVQLADRSPLAVITENGGWTSHTFIISRELNLPAVTGIHQIFHRLRDGDRVIVDGFAGQVVINPSPETLEQYAHPERIGSKEPGAQQVFDCSPNTLDGKEIIIRANADSPAMFERAKVFGVCGVGLYRSEFLFSRSKGYPSEAAQTDAYRNIANAAGDHGAKIRTFDLNNDNGSDEAIVREKNPALGLRAVRLSLSNIKELRTQIRSLLIASRGTKIDIVVPMISGVSEILAVAEYLESERSLLNTSGIETGSPRLGAMIEVPSAVLVIEQILEHTDFVCLGTNDLVQYLLAVDRDNESVANWYSSLHPSVIRAIKMVIDSANTVGRELVICGEMAGSAYYIPLLIGLGARELSMNVNSVSKVRKFISSIAYDECRKLAMQILACKTSLEAEDILEVGIKTNWGHLFPDDFPYREKR